MQRRAKPESRYPIPPSVSLLPLRLRGFFSPFRLGDCPPPPVVLDSRRGDSAVGHVAAVAEGPRDDDTWPRATNSGRPAAPRWPRDLDVGTGSDRARSKGKPISKATAPVVAFARDRAKRKSTSRILLCSPSTLLPPFVTYFFGDDFAGFSFRAALFHVASRPCVSRCSRRARKFRLALGHFGESDRIDATAFERVCSYFRGETALFLAASVIVIRGAQFVANVGRGFARIKRTRRTRVSRSRSKRWEEKKLLGIRGRSRRFAGPEDAKDVAFACDSSATPSPSYGASARAKVSARSERWFA